MSKLLDRLHIPHEGSERVHEVPESHEVREHHRRTTETPRAASGIRWLRWLGAFALIAGGGVLGYTMFVYDEGTDVATQDVSSQQLVQESIDEALAANQPDTLGRAVLDLEANAPTPASSYQLVQDAIDQALAANQPFTPWLTPTAGPGSNTLAPVAALTPVATGSVGTGQIPQPGLPDGYWQATDAATPSDDGRVLQPGLPDGYYQG
ncbi:MAG: hypothetical protein HKN44_02280 [Ilumatobacter sp.]|nr:hypothetical protein [Ilumatobacter sp.]